MEKNVVESLRPIIEEIVLNCNLHLYDLEYVYEDGAWFLRVSIEKDDGTMDFETAEVVSNLLSKKLDELDPIDHSYILDVCSPGIERPIRDLDEFKNHINDYITVYLKEPIEKKKDSYTGDLLEVTDDKIVLSYKDKTKIKKIEIEMNNISKAHVAVKF